MKVSRLFTVTFFGALLLLLGTIHAVDAVDGADGIATLAADLPAMRTFATL